MAAENTTTPTKVSARNPICRLCGESKESRYVIKVFGNAGLTKEISRYNFPAGFENKTSLYDNLSHPPFVVERAR